MAAEELVDASGWISDESSFCGGEETLAKLEELSRRQLKLPCQQASGPVAKRHKMASTERPEENPAQVAPAHAASNGDYKSNQSSDVSQFLKSRPQIVKMDQDVVMRDAPCARLSERTSAGEDMVEPLDQTFEGNPAAKQHSESIDDFLKRLPIAEPDTAQAGPWLWVGDPRAKWEGKKRTANEDIECFCERGKALLLAFDQQRLKIEGDNPEKAPATITRKMSSYRGQLEKDIRSAATDTGTTCGKWMLFPDSSDLPRYWRLVAQATSEGRLGPTSKAATPDHNSGKGDTLICVYTYDFSDLADVRRVLYQLVDLELCRPGARAIFYKCDAYTYLSITSQNPYRLRASLYSSADFL